MVILERIYQRGVTRRDRKGQIVHADQALLFQRRRQDEPFVKQLQPFAAAGIDFHIAQRRWISTPPGSPGSPSEGGNCTGGRDSSRKASSRILFSNAFSMPYNRIPFR